MPFQNRVAPTGELHTVSSRGTLMGNRGIIHDVDGRILKTHAHQNWVTCALHYKGRKKVLMAHLEAVKSLRPLEADKHTFDAGKDEQCQHRRERHH